MKTHKTHKINIVTLGCSKNLVDSENLMSQIKNGGYKVVHNSNDTDAKIVIINTCGFIKDAKEESIDTILEFIKAKKQGIIKEVYVMGCLSERYKDTLRQEIPEVDEYFKLKDLDKLLNCLNINYKQELLGERELHTTSHHAYLKISEGCDRKCSFCAIPIIRGKHISRPIEELVKETEYLAGKGVKELNLIAQDLTYYGRDIYKKANLAKLLNELSNINGIEWIRLHYTYPAGFPMDLPELIRDNPKICNYIDIPVQHINDKVLKNMRRGINKDETYKLLETLRNKISGVYLRTTLLVGHPGETKEAFEELKKFVKTFRFERLGVFTYSHEEDTYSYKNFKDEISEKIKTERSDELMKIQNEISYEHNQTMIGKVFDIIIDRKENEFYIGRTRYDSPDVDNEVLIPKEKIELLTGNIYKSKIISADEYDIYAQII
ncbi:30S ribosomal protein S12 methylthiotransferase RimO [Bacteroidota bacterium]